MSSARRPKVSTTPGPLEAQLSAAVAAVAATEAAYHDADERLAALGSEFITNPDKLADYVTTHAKFAALGELLSDLRFHEAEIREAIQAQKDRAAAAAQAKADAEAAEIRAAQAAERARIAGHPDNACQIAAAFIRAAAEREMDIGRREHMPAFETETLIRPGFLGPLGLAHVCRAGHEGEPAVIVENRGAFDAWLAKWWKPLAAGRYVEIFDQEGERVRHYSPSQTVFTA